MGILSQLPEETLELIGDRLSIMFDPELPEYELQVYVRFDEACEMLGQINETSSTKYETIGERMGLKVNRKSKLIKSIEGEHYSSDYKVIDGEHVYYDPDMNDWSNPVRCLVMPIKYNVIETPGAEVTEILSFKHYSTTRVNYLGERILLVRKILSNKKTSMFKSEYADTPENKKYYGFRTWKGKTYTRGVTGYHSGSRKFKNQEAKEKSVMRVGIEIEKEYKRGYNSLSHEYIKDRFGWAGETDSSLDDYGYELVSPIYDMKKLSLMFKDLDHLQEFIDSPKHSDNAGGHINVSCDKLSKGKYYNHGSNLLHNISGFICMLYAMYPDRAENGYSRARKLSEHIESPSKRAFYPKEDRLEIRIFPEVETVADLKNRIRLCKYMMEQNTKRTDVVIARMFNPKTNLHKLLKAMGYNVLDLAKKTMEFSAKIEDERFSIKTHKRLKSLGVEILTPAKRSKKEKSAALTKLRSFASSNDLEDLIPAIQRELEEGIR